MKNLLLTIYFFLFFIHQLFEKLNFNNSFIDSYLDDFLFLPLFLFTVERITSFLIQDSFELTKIQKSFLIVFILIIVEFIFPLISNRFTFDWLDFLAYGLGFSLFNSIIFINKQKKIYL